VATEKPTDRENKPEEKSPSKETTKPAPPKSRRAQARIAVVAGAVLVGIIAWLVTRDSGGSSEPAPTESSAPRIVTLTELQETQAILGQPIYWAGPIKGKELQLTELSEGGVQVLYLPEGTEAGKASPKSLTIGSYPLHDPTAALEGYAKRKGSRTFHSKDGREVVTSAESPTSAYFVSPENSVQVEVYDPSAKRALGLALSAKVNPVG
jgi:hypothetical protein